VSKRSTGPPIRPPPPGRIRAGWGSKIRSTLNARGPSDALDDYAQTENQAAGPISHAYLQRYPDMGAGRRIRVRPYRPSLEADFAH